MKLKGLGLIVLAFIMVSASCGPFQMLDKRSKIIAASKGGIIRGASFDISPDSVKAIEKIAPTIDQDGYLSYTILPEDFPSETLKVDYMFNIDNQLDIIAIDYRTKDEKAIQQITDNLKKFFQKRHGDGRTDELGWNTWDIKDTIGNKGTIEIVLLSENDPDYQGVKLELVKYFEGEE